MNLAVHQLPKIGTDIPAVGGVFAGILAGTEGGEDIAVFIGPDVGTAAAWSTQKKRAAGITVHGLSDFDLGDRREHRLAFINVPHLFEKDCYWTKEQHAATSATAWTQNFNHGCQSTWSKNLKLRARAVRRSSISQFLNFLAAAQTPEVA